MKASRSDQNDPAHGFRLPVRQPLLRSILAFCLFEAAFYFAYTYGMSFSKAAASPFWFPDSVLLCALLMVRPRWWWVVIFAPLPIRLFAEVAQGIPLWFLLATFANDSLKGLLTAAALRRYLRNPIRFDSVREFALYCLFAVLLVPAASAFGGAAARHALGNNYWTAWEQWFLGDALAQLVVTPLIFYWVLGVPWTVPVHIAIRWVEGALLTAGLIVSAYVAFDSEAGGADFAEPRFYGPVPFLFWAAIRFGMLGASGAIAVIAFFSVAAALQGHGPFSGGSPGDTALALQHFLLLRAAPLYLVAVLVEQRKDIEDSLRESEERFRSIANTAPALIWIAGPDKLCEFFNQGWLEFTGRPLREELGNGWTEGVHREDLQRCLATYHSSFDARQEFNVEYRLRRNDGNYRWILDRGVPRYTPEGKFVGYIGSATDITEDKQAEEALRKSEAKFSGILSIAADAIISVDESQKITLFNEGAEKIFGYTKAEVLGQSLGLLIPERFRAAHRGHIHGFATSVTIARRMGERREIFGIRKGGEEFSAEASISQLEVHGQRIFTVVLRDISERKRTDEALRNALIEVQQLKERLEAENVYLRAEVSEAHRYGDLVGESEGIRRVLRQVEQVVATDMTVLILGETGTGKELIARAVHEHSPRRDRPLVKVNCSALPAELIESELFGHEQGAFTGAMTRQVGRFELADGGTIFLDEIGDLALGLQAKLLRVLQDGEFERLGSSKTIKVNVRVIAATNRNLSEAIQEGRFRSDLYYRLNVYPIRLPPLRERRQDISLLARTFLAEASRRLGRVYMPPTARVLEALQGYNWPGNVRELQNVIERAAVTSSGPLLQLPEGWKLPSPLAESSPGALVTPGEATMPIYEAIQDRTLDQFERVHIVQVLEQTDWRIEGPQGAAVILGLKPSTLRSRIHKLQISRPVSH